MEPDGCYTSSYEPFILQKFKVCVCVCSGYFIKSLQLIGHKGAAAQFRSG